MSPMKLCISLALILLVLPLVVIGIATALVFFSLGAGWVACSNFIDWLMEA